MSVILQGNTTITFLRPVQSKGLILVASSSAHSDPHHATSRTGEGHGIRSADDLRYPTQHRDIAFRSKRKPGNV